MRISILLAFLFTSMIATAQNNYLGLRAGLNLSTVQGSGALTKYTVPTPGICAGLTYEHTLNPSAGLGIEFWYNQRGFRYSEGFPANIDYTVSLSYISLPLKVALKSKGNFHFKMNVGGIPSYLITSEGGNTSGIKRELDTQGAGIDISLLAEMGFGYTTAGGTRLYMLGGYQYGIASHKFYNGTQATSFNHSDFMVSVGFMSPLSKGKSSGAAPAEK